MRVMAEISNADKFSEKELISKINYFKASGADIIDLGFGLNAKYDEAIQKIQIARKSYTGILSIDTSSEKLLLDAQDHGIDLLLSLNRSNYSLAESITIPCVVTPSDSSGNLPDKAKNRVDILFDLIEKINVRFIADPILNPPLMKLYESLTAYRLFRERNQEIPLFFGVGNVTELIDADSIGVNALLASIGQELQVNILFTPEESRKCYQSVHELSVASKMMFLAKNAPPKHLGIDLLRIKEKKRKKMHPTYANNVIHVDKIKEPKISKEMYFKIFIDKNLICATFYKENKPNITLTSEDPSKLYKKLIEMNLIDTIDHAAYLGMELQKAHLAIKTNRSYQQEVDLF